MFYTENFSFYKHFRYTNILTFISQTLKFPQLFQHQNINHPYESHLIHHVHGPRNISITHTTYTFLTHLLTYTRISTKTSGSSHHSPTLSTRDRPINNPSIQRRQLNRCTVARGARQCTPDLFPRKRVQTRGRLARGLY